MNKFTIFVEIDANNGHGVVVHDNARKTATRLDAFSEKHAQGVALCLLELLPKLHRQATVVFDTFALPVRA